MNILVCDYNTKIVIRPFLKIVCEDGTENTVWENETNFCCACGQVRGNAKDSCLRLGDAVIHGHQFHPEF